jgi:hypothetical protein
MNWPVEYKLQTFIIRSCCLYFDYHPLPFTLMNGNQLGTKKRDPPVVCRSFLFDLWLLDGYRCNVSTKSGRTPATTYT